MKNDSSSKNINSYPNRSYLGSLTGLRFFAALYVLLFHSGAGFAERSNVSGAAIQFLQNGYLGVSLFFILSGFILTHTYKEGVANHRLFFLARIARVYPVYVLALILTLPLAMNRLDSTSMFKVIFMIQAWSGYSSSTGFAWLMQAWSLSVEAGFYLLFPMIAKYLLKCSKVTCAVLVCGCSITIIVLGTSSIFPGAVRPDLPAWASFIPLPLLRLPEFILGMLLCRMHLLSNAAFKKWIHEVLSIVVVAVIIAICALTKQNYHLLGVVSVLFGALLLLLARQDIYLAELFSNKLFQALGVSSYAMYLLQGPIRGWAAVLFSSTQMAQLVSPVILIIFSVFVYKFIERPARTKIIGKYGRSHSTSTNLNDRVVENPL